MSNQRSTYRSLFYASLFIIVVCPYRFPDDGSFVETAARYVKTVRAESDTSQGAAVLLHYFRKGYSGRCRLALALVLHHRHVPEFDVVIVAASDELVNFRERTIAACSNI